MLSSSRSPRGTRTKVCGVTSVRDAELCIAEGVDAIGINLIASSARFVDEATAADIAKAIRGRAMSVGVVANMSAAAMLALRDRLALDCLQLHGDEPPEALAPLLPHAYKAIRVATREDVARADAFGGDYILADARHGAELGGTGHTFDWTLVATLAKTRKLTLAGGLTPENVAEAIRVVSPYCVDVASGVEIVGDPRRKDRAKIRAFVAASRGS